jgi:GNAT superfamily N-acetyltransferase
MQVFSKEGTWLDMRKHVRAAIAQDVPAMVGLSEQDRSKRQKLEPDFFRKAERGAVAQAAYFNWQLMQPNVIAVVHQTENGIDGFAIASLITAPPVYEPGGTTALIDDFTVADPESWNSVGTMLFEAVKSEAGKRGAVGVVSICAHKDEVKRRFLSGMGLRIVSEWHFAAIKP